MLQKKVCMVGVFGTGKTCLVQRYVHSIFAVKYQSTVGVKIDRKPVAVDGTDLTLLLWDIAGRDREEDIALSYLRGAHGIIYVVDGTRRDTFEQMFELRELVRSALGDVPSVVAVNKIDLTDEWALTEKDLARLTAARCHPIRTSAKSGEGVEATFARLARDMLTGGTRP